MSMLIAVTCSSRGTEIAAGVWNFAWLVWNALKRRSKAWLNEGPWASVFAFFLRPSDLSVLVEVKLFNDRCEGEGWKLLHSNDCEILLTKLLSFSEQIVVDLAWTENDLTNISGIDFLICFTDDSLEALTRGKIFQIRTCISQLQKFFGRNHNKRLSERSD